MKEFGGVAETLRWARKLIVRVIGVTVLLMGIALVVLPGPAFIIIPLGLGILATEFVWARRMLDRLRAGARRALGQKPEEPAQSPRR